MGIGIQCILRPEVPSAESFFTDGKNIAQAFMEALMGDFEMDFVEGDLAEEPETKSDEADEPTIFSALEPFLDKSGGMLTGNFGELYAPSDGLVAIEQTLLRVRGEEGTKAIPDPELREGCIFDLETFAKQLREAQNHGAQFAFVFDL